MGVNSATQSELLRITAAVLNRETVCVSDIDINVLLDEAIDQSIFSLVFAETLSSSKVIENTDDYNRLNNSLLAVNMRVMWEHNEIHRIMTEANIPYVILKGASSSVMYPVPERRAMGDVDCLINASDISAVDVAMRNSGYVKIEDEDSDIHISYRNQNNGTVVEVHWEPNGIPDSDVGKMIREDMSGVLSNTVTVNNMGCDLCVPNEYYHGLILILHNATHLINTGIGLRHLCDWAVFIKRFDEQRFQQIFEKKLKSYGLWHFACILCVLCSEYLGNVHFDCCYEETKEVPLEEVMNDILNGGNFGTKDSQRINQAKLITNRGKGTVDDTCAFVQLFTTLNEKAKNTMQICKKNPIFLPLGWIYVIIRHIGRIIGGKRPVINPVETVLGAGKRKNIYQCFKLFVR